MSVAKKSIGKWAIVRSGNEGVNFGLVKDADETGIVLTYCRRLWEHRPLKQTSSWYEGVAMHGIATDQAISGEVIEKTIIEKYSITLCTDEARDQIRAIQENPQS